MPRSESTSRAFPVSALRFRRLLLTGAAGGLGRELRWRLKPYCEALRISDKCIVMANGRVRLCAEAAEILAMPDLQTLYLGDAGSGREALPQASAA